MWRHWLQGNLCHNFQIYYCVFLLIDAVVQNWGFHQIDFKNAFLHGELSKKVYMHPPLGFYWQGEQVVCRLNKSLYGLKQASQSWFHSSLLQSKILASNNQTVHGDSFITILLYVNDMVIIGNNEEVISDLKKHLSTCVRAKDLGPLDYFLRVEFVCFRARISIFQ